VSLVSLAQGWQREYEETGRETDLGEELPMGRTREAVKQWKKRWRGGKKGLLGAARARTCGSACARFSCESPPPNRLPSAAIPIAALSRSKVEVQHSLRILSWKGRLQLCIAGGCRAVRVGWP
jgi:hypothetical protein